MISIVFNLTLSTDIYCFKLDSMHWYLLYQTWLYPMISIVLNLTLSTDIYCIKLDSIHWYLNGVKQVCILAPTLFNLMFAVLLTDALKNTTSSIYMRYRVDGGVYNLQRLRARTKVMHTFVRELLFSDDCALMTHTVEDIQELTSCFARAAKRFGLKISLTNTEVMHQLKPGHAFTKPSVKIDDTILNAVEQLCYLGSVLSQDAASKLT